MAEPAWLNDGDLTKVASILEFIKRMDMGDLDLADGTRLILMNKADYMVGTLALEEGQWRFELYDERIGK